MGAYTFGWNVDADSSIIEIPTDGFLYELIVTDENGCMEEESFLFETSAVFTSAAKAITVYPNPTDGDIILQLDRQVIDQLHIYNIQGVAMNFSQRPVSNEGIAIDLHHLQAGAYILHAIINGDLYYQKVIVQ